jgi:hypothetical protein
MAAAAAAAAAAQQTIAGKQAQLRAHLASCHQHIHARPQPPPASYSSSSCSAPAPAPAAAGAQPSCLCPPPAITSHICISRPHPKCRFDGWLCRSCPFPPFCLSLVCARACVCMPEPPIRAAHPCNSPQPPRRRRWRVNGAPHSPPLCPTRHPARPRPPGPIHIRVGCSCRRCQGHGRAGPPILGAVCGGRSGGRWVGSGRLLSPQNSCCCCCGRRRRRRRGGGRSSRWVDLPARALGRRSSGIACTARQ